MQRRHSGYRCIHAEDGASGQEDSGNLWMWAVKEDIDVKEEGAEDAVGRRHVIGSGN